VCCAKRGVRLFLSTIYISIRAAGDTRVPARALSRVHNPNYLYHVMNLKHVYLRRCPFFGSLTTTTADSCESHTLPQSPCGGTGLQTYPAPKTIFRRVALFTHRALRETENRPRGDSFPSSNHFDDMMPAPICSKSRTHSISNNLHHPFPLLFRSRPGAPRSHQISRAAETYQYRSQYRYFRPFPFAPCLIIMAARLPAAIMT
jgi:hypothetical protein